MAHWASQPDRAASTSWRGRLAETCRREAETDGRATSGWLVSECFGLTCLLAGRLHSSRKRISSKRLQLIRSRAAIATPSSASGIDAGAGAFSLSCLIRIGVLGEVGRASACDRRRLSRVHSKPIMPRPQANRSICFVALPSKSSEAMPSGPDARGDRRRGLGREHGLTNCSRGGVRFAKRVGRARLGDRETGVAELTSGARGNVRGISTGICCRSVPRSPRRARSWRETNGSGPGADRTTALALRARDRRTLDRCVSYTASAAKFC